MVIMRERPWGLLGFGLILYVLLQALCVGVPAIGGSSEAREAQVVDVIVRDGSWILPLRNGVIPSKPPLFHWLAALVSMASGGVNEFSVRLTSQLAAALCLLLVAAVAYRLASLLQTFQGPDHPRRAALLAAGILSLTYGFYIMGCQAMVDMTFAACVWASLAAVVYGIQRADPGSKTIRIHWLGRALFWLFACVAVFSHAYPLPLCCLFACSAVCGCIRRDEKKPVS
jgi:4-amino-4-deoxy-L-arabinose transferase-like glycosyltransferase